MQPDSNTIHVAITEYRAATRQQYQNSKMNVIEYLAGHLWQLSLFIFHGQSRLNVPRLKHECRLSSHIPHRAAELAKEACSPTPKRGAHAIAQEIETHSEILVDFVFIQILGYSFKFSFKF